MQGPHFQLLKKVRRYPGQNPDVMALCLPVARPELNAIDVVWQKAKYRLITAEFYKTLDDLKAAVSVFLDMLYRGQHLRVSYAQYLTRNFERSPE